MLRTQIQLTEDQARRLRRLASREGVSMAEMVRQSIDRLLNDEARHPAARYRRAAALIGAFPDRDGAKDLSRHHDEYIGQSDE